MTDVTTLLAGIKTRAEKATEGPWAVEEYVDIDEDGSFDLAHVIAPDPNPAAVSGVAMGILRKDAAFIAAARTDVPRLVAALEAMAGLHKPVTYWMTHEDADISYQTKEDALNERTDLTEADLIPFDLCGHCKTVEEGPCDGECTQELGYRESLWPCPTITAVVAVLGGGE